MRERPILFSGPLVVAILDGRKTVTRRPMRGRRRRAGGTVYTAPCAVGDLLYVRETTRDHALTGAGSPWRIEYRADGAVRDLPVCPSPEHMSSAPRWRPSIHMPRALARLHLRVVGVRYEPVTAITEEDARLEGFEDRAAFLAAWAAIYGSTSGDCWRIAFEREVRRDQ